MSDLHHDEPPGLMERIRVKHQESNAMLAILMAGIAALFIIGIVAAYNYASRDVSTAQNPPAASTSTTGSGAAGTAGADRSPPRRTEKDDAEGLPKRP